MPAKADKKITAKLSDLDKVCRACGKVSNTTRMRSYNGSDYQGSCGDSFCWASCDMTACKGIHARVCDSCEKAKAVPA